MGSAAGSRAGRIEDRGYRPRFRGVFWGCSRRWGAREWLRVRAGVMCGDVRLTGGGSGVAAAAAEGGW